MEGGIAIRFVGHDDVGAEPEPAGEFVGSELERERELGPEFVVSRSGGSFAKSGFFFVSDVATK